MFTGKSKTLGVIGGMGPGATQLFYKMVIDYTEAGKDQDHLDMIILNHASMPDRTRAILSDSDEKRKKVLNLLVNDAKTLERLGCSCIAIPCNTSHYFVESVEKECSLPVIHMIRETVRQVAKDDDVRKVGVLATDGTIQTGLYQQELEKAGIEAIVPSEACQKDVMKIIYGIKSHKEIEFSSFVRIQEELQKAGCKKVILGCTELSVLKEEFKLPLYYVDAMEMLAKACIRFCGKQVR